MSAGALTMNSFSTLPKMGRTVAVAGDRRSEHEGPVSRCGRGDIPRPCRKQQGETVTHQKAVARVLRRRRIVVSRYFTVQLAQNCDVAAIVDVVEKRL